MMKSKKSLQIALVTAAMMILSSVTVFGATFSEFWKEDGNGNWYVEEPGKGKVTNAWLCDDAVAENGKEIWYLLGPDGRMVSSPLVQDGTGNYYSLETEHNGYYGMLRYKSGTYDGVTLSLESSHNGAFAAIKNADGIEALKSRYGVTDVSGINNNNCVYTSSFKGGAAPAAASAVAVSSTDERLKYLREYYGMPDETEEQKYAKMMHVIFDLGRSYGDMTDRPKTYAFYKNFLTSIDWPHMSEHDRLEACFNVICCDEYGSGQPKGYGNGNYYEGAHSDEVRSGEFQIPAFHHGMCGDYALALLQLGELTGLRVTLHDIQLGGVPHQVCRVWIDGTEYQIDPTQGHDYSMGFDCNLKTLDDPEVIANEW